jgi:thiol-disulfide isomerase/thioredoxin
MLRYRTVLLGLLVLFPAMATATLQVGDPAPDFTLPDTAYVNHSLSEYRGDVVLLDFWQSTCGACRAELPRLQVMYEDYGEHGFTPLTINLSESMETVKLYARLATHPYLRDGGSVWNIYKQNNYIPLNYIVDTSGVIRFWQEGFNEEQIDALIRQYLPDPIEHDVGVTGVMAPRGSVDSGHVAVPACSLFNYGEYTETYPVRMRIGTRYDTVAMITDHAPGTARYVEFPQWTALERGLLRVACTTELAGDDIRSNNGYEASVTVHVYDLAVTMILAPADSVDSASTVVPAVVVENFGTVADMVRVRFYIGDGYADSVNVPLHPGRCDTAYLGDWTPHELGSFAVLCSVYGRWEMVPANNRIDGTVYVGRAIGIAEEPGTGLGVGRVPTVVNRVLYLKVVIGQ